MDDCDISQKETINSFLSSLVRSSINKRIVESMVVDDFFEHDGYDSRLKTPSTRLDGAVANYFTFFKECYLSHPSGDLEKEDSDLLAAEKVLCRLATAYEVEDKEAINKISAILFDANVKQNPEEFAEAAQWLETIMADPECKKLGVQDKTALAQEFKASYMQTHFLTFFRKTLAEHELVYHFKYPTLEKNLDAIIYATILHTEHLLAEHGIECSMLSGLWGSPNFFCDTWFAATIPDISEKSVTFRENLINESESWPDYAKRMTFILDYAAIIQDRLFGNHQLRPDFDWRKESFKIWNSYAAAALRLGEIFNKYKNNLPFDDEDIRNLNIGGNTGLPLIITEGKTDWKHLKTAYRALLSAGKYQNLKIQFNEDNEPLGQDMLATMCKSYARVPNIRPFIFIADSDTKHIVADFTSPGANFKSWGNNVFSFCIPTPPHRRAYKNISIEFYYSDEEIHTVDPDTGRKLIFSNEVKKIITQSTTTGKTTQIQWLFIPPRSDEEFEKKIFDANCDEIVDVNGTRVACSKSTFADNIYLQKPKFDTFNFEHFSLIFDIIEEIVSSCNTNRAK